MAVGALFNQLCVLQAQGVFKQAQVRATRACAHFAKLPGGYFLCGQGPLVQQARSPHWQHAAGKGVGQLLAPNTQFTDGEWESNQLCRIYFSVFRD